MTSNRLYSKAPARRRAPMHAAATAVLMVIYMAIVVLGLCLALVGAAHALQLVDGQVVLSAAEQRGIQQACAAPAECVVMTRAQMQKLVDTVVEQVIDDVTTRAAEAANELVQRTCARKGPTI